MRKRAARWFGRLVLAAASGAALHAAYTLYDQAGHVARYARRYRAQPLAVAQDRILGGEYMASIRAIRETIGSSETVYLVDEGSSASGAPYFVAHYLAPRRVILLGSTRFDSARAIRKRLPRSAEWVVVVAEEGRALRLLRAEELRVRGRRRGR